MYKKIMAFLDFITSLIVTGLFLLGMAAMLVFARFKKESRGNIKNITQLYISIINFEESVLSTYKRDILLDGFIEKAFCYHFDFDKKSDTRAHIDKNICMNNISVHPDNAFTGAGFRKTMACLVEIKVFFAMLKVMRKEGVNIIRAHDPHLLGFNAYLLSRLTKTPFIVQVCSNYEIKDRGAKGLTFRPFMFKALERRFERAIMRSADMVMADRENYRIFGIIPKDIPDNRYANIGFFVDESHYVSSASRKSLRGDLGIPGDKKILLYVGRLCEVKYPLDLLKMFQQVLSREKDAIFLLAGEGVLENDMKAFAKQNEIEKSVFFLGKLPQDKLKDLYDAADIACFSSAGFTMIEAALAERCIVAYDFEWHSEFIGNNDRGILIPFGDYSRFAKEVLKALADSELRQKLGKEARSYAIKHYLRKDSIRKEIGFYKSIFKKRGKIIEKVL